MPPAQALLSARPSPDTAAYVIYTSGSTGKPKGVVVEHRHVVRLLRATEAWFHFGPDDVWTLFHSYAFDFSVWELWGALAYGGRLVLVPLSVSRAPDELHALLVCEAVTVLNQTPSAQPGAAGGLSHGCKRRRDQCRSIARACPAYPARVHGARPHH